uniref:Uncharacterized protein n=1 Tax=Hucho hucho TaxID=62062 RepID=A0A4W5N176_9TELE
MCSIFLGTGTVLILMGVIHYMRYFKRYNIPTLTLRAAFQYRNHLPGDIQQMSYLVWLFSRVYLYTLISFITDTYDTSKQQQEWIPVSALPVFMSECKDLPTQGSRAPVPAPP